MQKKRNNATTKVKCRDMLENPETSIVKARIKHRSPYWKWRRTRRSNRAMIDISTPDLSLIRDADLRKKLAQARERLKMDAVFVLKRARLSPNRPRADAKAEARANEMAAMSPGGAAPREKAKTRSKRGRPPRPAPYS
ncbi:hypothetical protein ACOJBM_40885 [Rhizobium beringeri]